MDPTTNKVWLLTSHNSISSFLDDDGSKVTTFTTSGEVLSVGVDEREGECFVVYPF